MSSDHSVHAEQENVGYIIDEKSIQDKFLSALAVFCLVGLMILGCYWQTLPLPTVHIEEESIKK